MDMQRPQVPEPQTRLEQFKFTGNASEFFGIWFVNHTLTWMTLGIYSAWAKVRTLQYFYGNTSIAGGHFMFTAKPTRILRARIIAFLLLVLYVVAENVSSGPATIVFLAFIVAGVLFAPILIILVMSFRARYSEWRGIKFHFRRNYKEGYFVYLLPTVLQALIIASLLLPFNSEKVDEFFGIEPYQWDALQEESDPSESVDQAYDDDAFESYGFDEQAYAEEQGYEESDIDSAWSDAGNDPYTEDEETTAEDDSYINPYWFIPAALLSLVFALGLPYFDFISQRFFCRNLSLGKAPFVYHARMAAYYKAYALWLACALAFVAGWICYGALDLGLLLVPMILLSIVFFPASQAYFKSARYNLMLNHTKIDNKHQLISGVRFPGLFWILMSNSVMIAITLGLMTAWAKVRTARYLLTNTSLAVQGSLDDFVAQQQAETNALGEEVADMFDIDVIA